MKTHGLLAVVAILASSALAQTPGFYVSAGGGVAKIEAGDFTQTTSYGEVIRTKEAKNGVAVARIEVGYQFNESWGLGLQFTDYSTAEIKMEYPKFTGLVSIVPFPEYSRHVFKYDTTRVALIPSYTFAAGDRMRIRAGLGATFSQTRSHFEADYYTWYSGRPNENRHDSYYEVKKTDLNFTASLGAEWVFTKHFSLGLTVAYAPYKIEIPSTGIADFGSARPSTSSVKVDAYEAAVTFVYRK